MVKLFFLLLIVMAQNVFCATIELNGGDIFVVKKLPTTVVCRNNCPEIGDSLLATLETCEKSHAAYICARTYVPKFKTSSPECKHSLIQACVRFCAETQSISCEYECTKSK